MLAVSSSTADATDADIGRHLLGGGGHAVHVGRHFLGGGRHGVRLVGRLFRPAGQLAWPLRKVRRPKQARVWRVLNDIGEHLPQIAAHGVQGHNQLADFILARRLPACVSDRQQPSPRQIRRSGKSDG